MKKRPFLKPIHIKNRLKFAKKYQYWTVEDREKVVFSDETKINLFEPDSGKVFCKMTDASKHK